MNCLQLNYVGCDVFHPYLPPRCGSYDDEVPVGSDGDSDETILFSLGSSSESEEIFSKSLLKPSEACEKFESVLKSMVDMVVKASREPLFFSRIVRAKLTEMIRDKERLKEEAPYALAKAVDDFRATNYYNFSEKKERVHMTFFESLKKLYMFSLDKSFFDVNEWRDQLVKKFFSLPITIDFDEDTALMLNSEMERAKNLLGRQGYEVIDLQPFQDACDSLAREHISNEHGSAEFCIALDSAKRRAMQLLSERLSECTAVVDDEMQLRIHKRSMIIALKKLLTYADDAMDMLRMFEEDHGGAPLFFEKDKSSVHYPVALERYLWWKTILIRDEEEFVSYKVQWDESMKGVYNAIDGAKKEIAQAQRNIRSCLDLISSHR